MVWDDRMYNDDIYAQRFDASGQRRGGDFQMSVFLTGTFGLTLYGV